MGIGCLLNPDSCRVLDEKESVMISARKEYAIGQLLKNANDLEIKGNIPQAMDEIRKAIDLNPEDGNLYNRLGDLYLKTGDKKESMDNFRKGVDAFRRDNFLRNALALSKKILRHEPNGFDMYYTIADILVELGEKQDAAGYMFEYIEKQTEQNRTKEVLNAIDYLRSLEVKDDRIEERILEYYNAASKEAATVIPEVEKGKKRQKPEQVDVAEGPRPEFKLDETDKERKPRLVEFFDTTGVSKKDTGQLDESMKSVEQAIVDLRKTIRFDDVVLALEESLGSLSVEQRKAIGNMQQSVTDNLDNIRKSLKELYDGSGRSMKELHGTLDNLNKALSSLSKNQASIAQQQNSNLTDLNMNFRSLTEHSLNMIKSVQDNYKQATEEMCCRLDDTNDANGKLIASTNDMKQELSKMGDSLSKFIIAQASKEKKRDRYITIILVIISIICGLFVVSLIFK
jgi:tetratricopeptide (TPR) repeat protein